MKLAHLDGVKLVPQILAHLVENPAELTGLLVRHPGAVKALAEAMGDFKRAVDALDDLPDGKLRRVSGQGETAVDSLVGADDARRRQLVQNLQGKALGHAGLLRNLPGADSPAPPHDGIDHAHRIIGFSRDFHRFTTAFVYNFSILLIIPFVKTFLPAGGALFGSKSFFRFFSKKH